MFAFATVSLVAFAATASAQFSGPTSPDATTVCRVGQACKTTWTADTTGTWAATKLQLMSGSNLQMIPVTTLTENLDVEKTTEYEFTTPEVTPTSAIYFLQFTSASNSSTMWTTRFTIAGADGSTTTPSEADQPESSGTGTPIPWGTGTLVSGNGTTSADTSSSNSSTSSAASSAAPRSSSAAVSASSAASSAAASGALGAAVASGSAKVASASASVASVSGAPPTAVVGGGAALAAALGAIAMFL